MPAEPIGGSPSAPVTASVARQLLLMMQFGRIVAQGLHARAQGILPATSSPEHARGGAWPAPPVLGQADPQLIEQDVAVDRVLDAREQLLDDRNGVGAMPVAMPECTPSVSTRTCSVPVRLPRSEVVHQTWS